MAVSALGLYMAHQGSIFETTQSRLRHKDAIQKAEMQHKESIRLAKQAYLIESATSLEQHFQQLNADLLDGSKESERDMFDQRNQQFQTIILAASVMFSALSTVIIQGILPPNSGSFIVIAYGLTSSLSFAFLFLCMVLCIKVVKRASDLMYRRANAHTKAIHDAMSETKKMMKAMQLMSLSCSSNSGDEFDAKVKRSGNYQDEYDAAIEEMSSDESDSDTRNGPEEHPYVRPLGADEGGPTFADGMMRTEVMLSEGNSIHQKILKPEYEHELKMIWRTHQEKISSYLRQREEINKKTLAIILSKDAKWTEKPFHEFWESYCRLWGQTATSFFYAGSANLLLAIMLWMWAEWLLEYNTIVGSIIAISLIGSSLAIGVSIPWIIEAASRTEINGNNSDNLSYENSSPHPPSTPSTPSSPNQSHHKISIQLPGDRTTSGSDDTHKSSSSQRPPRSMKIRMGRLFGGSNQ